jgi:hypothetical protein
MTTVAEVWADLDGAAPAQARRLAPYARGRGTGLCPGRPEPASGHSIAQRFE